MRLNVKDRVIDIVLDNVGFEFVIDFCLVEVFLMCGWADFIRMYGKVMLWFVFDVISSDFEWIFDFFVKLLRFFMVYFGELWR